MAGHSKWANIKHRKGAQDAARAKMFAKFSKEIMVAVSTGGPDPASNPSLRLAISKAKAKSMPKSNIEKVIAKASGNKGEGANFKEIIYSGTLKKGVVFLVICLTDNFNRLSSEIQYLFKRANGTIGKVGSIPYNFKRIGLLEFDLEEKKFDDIVEELIELPISDIQEEKGLVTITTDPSDFNNVKEELEKLNYSNFKTAEITYDSDQKITLSTEDTEQLLDTIDNFEDNEDIQEVFHNLDLSVLEE